MNKFLFILFVSFSAFAWDSGPGNFTGKYVITHSEVCSSFGLYYNCIITTEYSGKAINIIQSKVNDEYMVCVNKNFNDYLTNNHCYKNILKENSTLKISSSGFKAENAEIHEGRKISSTYTNLTRTGAEFILKDGGSVRGLLIYYNHTMEKVNN